VKLSKVRITRPGRKRPAAPPLERPAAGRDQGRQPAPLSWDGWHHDRPEPLTHDQFIARLSPNTLQAAFIDLAHRATPRLNPDPAEYSDAQWAVTRRWILERRAAIGRALMAMSPDLHHPENHE
jgi:hypothetical protein